MTDRSKYKCRKINAFETRGCNCLECRPEVSASIVSPIADEPTSYDADAVARDSESQPLFVPHSDRNTHQTFNLPDDAPCSGGCGKVRSILHADDPSQWVCFDCNQMDRMLQRVPSVIVESARRHLMVHWNDVTSTSEDTERLVAQYASDLDAMKFLDWREMVDIVNDPGKFEGELNIVIRMWELACEGADTDVHVGDTHYSFVKVSDVDETLGKLFDGELFGACLWEDSNGFVRSEWCENLTELKNLEFQLSQQALAQAESEDGE